MVSMAVRSTRRYMAAFLAGGRKAAAIRRSGVVEAGKGTRAPGAGCGALCGCVCVCGGGEGTRGEAGIDARERLSPLRVAAVAGGPEGAMGEGESDAGEAEA